MSTTSMIMTTFLRAFHVLGHVLGPAALGLALGVGGPACGGDGGGDAGDSTGPLECEHGMAYDCACPDGSMGTQMCAHDSSGFEQCVCGADDGSSGTGGSAGGSSGTTSEPPGSSGPEPATETSADGSTSVATTATSEETSTNGAAPTAQINHPGDGEMRPAGVDIPFIGEASDLEDGVLTGASLVWVSSLEGEIGQGETFDAMLLTLGEHTITLTATDADGNIGEDSIAIVVFE
jgi:hypothetical protein